MSANILNGRLLSEKIKKSIKDYIRIKNLAPPGLEVILVGDNPASMSYVQHKQKACEFVGIRSNVHHLPDNTSEQELSELIHRCNAHPEVHGILLQLPLPHTIAADNLLEQIDPKKDVDGFHPYNLGRLIQRRPLLRPCTPYGIMLMLQHAQVELAGKHAVVIGASNIVGRPMALELLLAKSTVTICHRFTQNLARHVQEADILIAAIGKPGIIKSEWLKPRAIVIDVGFTRMPDGAIYGDIEFTTAKEKASWITPVPGGVGPMTVAILLQNTLLAATLNDALLSNDPVGF